jgi:hypothetical protein
MRKLQLAAFKASRLGSTSRYCFGPSLARPCRGSWRRGLTLARCCRSDPGIALLLLLSIIHHLLTNARVCKVFLRGSNYDGTSRPHGSRSAQTEARYRSPRGSDAPEWFSPVSSQLWHDYCAIAGSQPHAVLRDELDARCFLFRRTSFSELNLLRGIKSEPPVESGERCN